MIEIKNVTKIIKKKVVLDNVTYSFDYGTVYGIFGTNGSGKTMLLRMLAGLICPTEGQVIVDGKVLHRDISFPPDTGIIIENMELLPRYSGYDNLKYLGQIKKKVTDEDIRCALERVGLSTDLLVKKYSLGMKQRLNIAQAIFEKQRIILLDEPTNSLDGDGIEMLRKIVLEEKERGACIIIATHAKEDIEPVCDIVLKMDAGKLGD
jgi:ABC-2 type transport system ATP-binding protein